MHKVNAESNYQIVFNVKLPSTGLLYLRFCSVVELACPYFAIACGEWEISKLYKSFKSFVCLFAFPIQV